MNTNILSAEFLPPTLNDIIGAARTGKYVSSSLKKKWHKKLSPLVKLLPNMKGEVYLECVWFVKNRNRDQDNITAAQKYILDSLVEQKRIKDDNLSVIQSPVFHHFIISDFDGFSIYIRDKEAFKKRLGEDLSSPPSGSISLVRHRTSSPKRILRKK